MEEVTVTLWVCNVCDSGLKIVNIFEVQLVTSCSHGCGGKSIIAVGNVPLGGNDEVHT